MNTISKSLSASILSNFWTLLLLLLLTPLYVKFLGVESYGLIGFYTSLIAILSVLDMGISSTATREISWRSVKKDDRNTIPTLVKSLEIIYWLVILFLCFTLSIVGWFFGDDWFQVKNLSPEIIKTAFILMIFSLALQVPIGFYTAGLVGLQRQIQNSAFIAVFATIRGAGAIIILWKISPDIRAFFCWQILVNLFQIIFMHKFLWNKLNSFNKTSEFSKKIIKSIRSFTGGMILITALALSISQIDKIILSTTVSIVDYSYYMLAWSISSALMVLAIPIMQIYSPRFTRFISNDSEELLKLDIVKASRLMALIILPPTAFIMILSESILTIWLNNSDIATSVAPVLVLMMPGSMLIACAYPALNILYSRKQIKPVIIIHTAALVIFLPIIILAIVYYGIKGAAICWSIYGCILFLSYQILGLRGLSDKGILLFILYNFLTPCFVAFLCASFFGYWLLSIGNVFIFILFLSISLITTWFFILFIFNDFRLLLFNKISSFPILRSFK